jgi:hypothetical protein
MDAYPVLFPEVSFSPLACNIRVGASIQEQLNHLQMLLTSEEDERRTSFLLELKCTETITFSVWRMHPSDGQWILTLSAAFGSAPLSRSS